MNVYEAARNQSKLNEARLEQLIKDANAKFNDAHEVVGRSYWSGVEFGLRRALGVLQGKG